MTLEFELKLATDHDTLDLLSSMNLPEGWQGDSWQQQTLENHYYDTEDAELYGRRIALRIRRADDSYTQTVKSSGQSIAGVHQRQEYDAPVDSLKINANAFPDSDWGNWLSGKARTGALLPVFTTHFSRRSRVLTHHSGTVIELALDSGQISTDDDQQMFNEVELELKAGDSQALFDLATYLVQHYPLVPDNRSKAERGYRLLDWHKPPQSRLEPLKLADNATLWEIMRLAITQAWAHWQRYEKEFVTEPSVQSVEQMRRAIGLMRHILVCYNKLPLPDLVQPWSRYFTHTLKILHWVRHARAQIAADKIILSSQGENYVPHQDELEEALPDERVFTAGIDATQQLLNSRDYAQFSLSMARFLLLDIEPHPALHEPAAERATALVIRQWGDLQSIWRQAPLNADFSYYTQQRRLLRRALWSALLFGDLFEHRQRDLFIDPCRDLLAGVEDTATLKSIEAMARELSPEQMQEVNLWLEHQRETLWTAFNMTRDRALRAEPDDLDND